MTNQSLGPGCVLFFSGTTDVSFIDPVVIGRNVFSVTNDFVSGIAGYIQDVLCAVMDVILDAVQGTVSVVLINFDLIYVHVSLQYLGM